MAKREGLGTQRRWSILHHDNFTCAFCGARPGNDRLHVDHMIPHSRRGSDNDENLVTACDRCNNGKRDTTAIPISQCTEERHANGWVIWKRWGEWVLHWNPVGRGTGTYPDTNDGGPLVDDTVDVALTYKPDWDDYWIELQRVHEPDWHSHLREKPLLSKAEYVNFCEAIAFARRLVRRR